MAPTAQKQFTVYSPPENFYARWRRPDRSGDVLRDDTEMPPERLLQAIWRHQRLRRDRLRTVDGQAVRILHPGFVSVEGGPDFRGAVIQIGDQAPRSGDVEIDLRSGGWRAHGHDRNPAFHNVLLHVIWDEAGVPALAGRSREGLNRPAPGLHSLPPTLAVADKLDAPIAELGLWLENDSPRVLPENQRGRCCAVLRGLDEARQGRILDAAARVRFQAKAEQFRTRARHAGWEQAFWEGLFRALGYKHNVWPMQNLAETRPRWLRPPEPALAIQARLLGIGGLLPDDPPRSKDAADYLRRLWDCWWRERDEFADCMLPRSVWRFHGLRPANHPQRRLALAAHWLADGRLIPRLEAWCAADIPDRKLPGSLRQILEIKRDEFWSWHWTFRSSRQAVPRPLPGLARITDLAVNVILPWLWTRAAEGGNDPLRQVIEHRYAVWPLAEDNSVLKLARQRLLGAGRSRVLRHAVEQQGLIQITRDFCDHSNAVCHGCRFPGLVETWCANPLPQPGVTSFRAS